MVLLQLCISWVRYGSGTTNIGGGAAEVGLVAGGYKFFGNPGQYSDEGIWRSTIHDTTWSLVYDIGANSFYPNALASDNQSLWLIYYSHNGNQCYFTSSPDMGVNWTTPVGNIPMDTVSLSGCMEKLVPFGNNLYTFTNGTLWRMSGVANSIDSHTKLFEMNIFPNPVTGNSIMVETFHNTSPVNIMITDLKGSILVPAKSYHSKTIIVDLKQLPAGIYLMNLISQDKTTTKKFVITKKYQDTE